MKVAIVHDYLKEYGGAERVVEALHQIFPDAPVYTAYYNPDGLGPHSKRVKGWDIRTSWMQKMPFADKLISPFRIFAPLMFESFDLKQYDLVISSCAIYFAKAVITAPGSLHLSYIHTPPRYLYGYTTSFNYKKNPITRILGELANHFLRIIDFETSQRPDILIANSKNVAARIKKFYRRDAEVIYPPVDVKELSSKLSTHSPQPKDYFLSLGRLVRGKGVEVIVQAASELNLPLKVAGNGPELEYLKSLAGSNVEFVGEVSDEERALLYAGAKGFIVASEDEDFGITAVEAQACGTPVIAPNSGGYTETIVADKTGVFYPQVKVEDLKQALEDFNEKEFDSDECQKNALKFSQQNFRKAVLAIIDKNLSKG